MHKVRYMLMNSYVETYYNGKGSDKRILLETLFLSLTLACLIRLSMSYVMV